MRAKISRAIRETGKKKVRGGTSRQVPSQNSMFKESIRFASWYGSETGPSAKLRALEQGYPFNCGATCKAALLFFFRETQVAITTR